jgi:hypothetical protein
MSPGWSDDRASAPIGLVAALGVGLMVAGEIADRLEVDLGLDLINLILASLFAALAVSVVVLLGDSLITAIARRSGRRPSQRLVTLLLTLAGAATAGWIVIGHLSHPLALDGWLGLGGSLLLLIAALAHHHLPPGPGRAR